MNEKSSLLKKQKKVYILDFEITRRDTKKKIYNVTHHIFQFETKKAIVFFLIRIAKYHTFLYIPRVNVPVL